MKILFPFINNNKILLIASTFATICRKDMDTPSIDFLMVCENSDGVKL